MTRSTHRFNVQGDGTALRMSVLIPPVAYALENPIVDRLSDSLRDPLIHVVWIVQILRLLALFQQLHMVR